MNFSFQAPLQSGGFNFSMPNTENPFCNESDLLSAAPPEVQKMLVEIYDISKLYANSEKSDETETFENSICDLENSIKSLTCENLYNLSGEVDYGKNEVLAYRSELEEMRNVLAAITADHRKKKIFVRDYFNNLLRKSEIIKEAIESIENITDLRQSHAFFNDIQTNDIILSCQNQHNAILRCSSKICELQERTEFVRQKVEKYLLTKNSFNCSRNLSKDDSTEMSLTDQLIADYSSHQDERKRNLEKRHTDSSKFMKPKQQTSNFSFGTGTSNMFGGGQPKANFGTNNSISQSFGATNKMVASSAQNSLLATPQDKGNFTPVQTRATGEGFSGFAGNVTPTAPQKGRSKLIDSPPP
ncbi:hypothetical protein TRFO_06377 [Tritrichomonas foetus]|uniref:Uncharacterized protein n=1 Tax=Tritrichomonas foetus TaxID=1144522 RepID=A0A1J4JZQ7_9EUKA|nr:hypothetical protein TRFO_06377 [Tritrichomonas foetus]|eukprot:OHT04467.1 hypothetical protein TRFO_06377 [Tritrichomonas foetus]